jgi:alanine racemase
MDEISDSWPPVEVSLRQRRPGDGDRRVAAMRGAWMEVDLGAIASNVRAIRRFVNPRSRVMAVVKADGYGHGASRAARLALASGADWLGVATVSEALRLRELGVHQPILLLGLIVPEACQQALQVDLHLTVSDLWHLEACEAAARSVGRLAHVHLKVDTGMTRVGISLGDAPALVERIRSSEWLVLAGLETHMASGEIPGGGSTSRQLERFRDLDRSLALPAEVLRHVANSATTVNFPEAHLDMVRPGLAVYGLSPVEGDRMPFAITPAMRIVARVTQVRDVPAGVAIGYGGTFVTARPSKIALLPVGYGDGVPRALGNREHVLVGGVPCPLVGRVSMDQCTVDVTGLEVLPGQPVTVLGRDGDREIAVASWAEKLETIPYEIICGLGRRLPRLYVGG